MKTYLCLFFACAATLLAQPITVPRIDMLGKSTAAVLTDLQRQFSTNSGEPAKADADGVYRRVAGSVVLVSITTTGVVLECTYTPRTVMLCAVYHADGVCPDGAIDRTERWREIYVIRGDHLVLDRVVRPKVIPAQAQRVEWPELPMALPSSAGTAKLDEWPSYPTESPTPPLAR